MKDSLLIVQRMYHDLMESAVGLRLLKHTYLLQSNLQHYLVAALAKDSELTSLDLLLPITSQSFQFQTQ